MVEMWSEELMCHWYAWRAVQDGSIPTLALELPANNVCNMRGAVRVAKQMCPSVARIDVFSGGKPEIVYLLLAFRGGSGGLLKWQARNVRD